MNTKGIAVAVMLALSSLSFSFPSEVFAGPIVPEVDLVHKFNTRLIGNQRYRVAWQWADRAIAQDTAGVDIDTNGPGNTGILIPPANGSESVLALSPLISATANMTSSFVANPDGSGEARVKGKARIFDNNGILATSEGLSTVALNRGVADRNGNIKWGPEWKFHTARTGRIGDPIFVEYFDLDNLTTLSSTLFDLDMAFAQGGDSTYQNGDLFISGTEGSFSLFMDSPYITTGVGTIEIAFSGGFISDSLATGIFSSLAIPSVGSSSMGFGFHLGDADGAFDIGFDFGSDPENVNGYEFQAQLGGDALIEADEVQPIPEPATWTLTLAAGILFARSRRNRLKPISSDLKLK